MSLLEEKVQLFRGMWEGLNPSEEGSRQVEPFFRSACSLEPPRGASVMKDALQEGKAEKYFSFHTFLSLYVEKIWIDLGQPSGGLDDHPSLDPKQKLNNTQEHAV